MPSDSVNGTSIIDAGNNRTRASGITSSLNSSGDASITGSVGSGSDSNDYYRFVAPATGSASFSLTGLSQNIDLRLLNGSGTSLRNGTTTGNSDERFSYQVTQGQTYYVQVDPSGTAVSDYSLNIDCIAAPV